MKRKDIAVQVFKGIRDVREALVYQEASHGIYFDFPQYVEVDGDRFYLKDLISEI
jgi:hypothetical protein